MTSTTDSTPFQAQTTRRGLSLRNKLLLPLFLILLLLGVAAIVGSMQLVRTSMTHGADDRLVAAKEVLYREFKKQETILNTYTVFLQQFQSLINHFPGAEETGVLQDRLYNTLEEENISATFYPVHLIDELPITGLKPLFDQARRSGQPRFRYTNEFGGIPTLMVAAPIQDRGEIAQILVLQTLMGDEFLRKVAAPLGIMASLHNLEGEILAKSDPSFSPLPLTEDDIITLGEGQLLFREHSLNNELNRHLFSAIPLGSSDLIFLSLETSVNKASELQQTLALRMGLTILGAFFLALLIYYRIVSGITQPVRDIKDGLEAVSRGNLGYKIPALRTDELGSVAASFNRMLDDLEQITQVQIDTALERAEREQQTKTELLLQRRDRDFSKISSELDSLRRETNALLQLNQAMIAPHELSILFDRILQVMSEVLHCDHIVLLSYNPGDSLLEVVRAIGLDNEILKDVKFNYDQGVTGEAAQSRRLIYVKDVDADERNLSYHGKVSTRGSLVSVPLVVKERLVGVLNLHKTKVDGFVTSELKLSQAVANQAAIAIDNAQLQEKARELSNIDDMTGLANRRHFQEILKREVAQARRFNSIFSIVMCDIDYFKEYNDSHGRMRGDALLRQVGQCLLKHTRGIDLVCRFGSAEFIILLPKTAKKGGVAAAEKLRTQISKEKFFGVDSKGADRPVTLSFGVTEFPSDSKNIYELLNLADRALYAAKKEGRNRTVAWEGPAPAPE